MTKNLETNIFDKNSVHFSIFYFLTFFKKKDFLFFCNFLFFRNFLFFLKKKKINFLFNHLNKLYKSKITIFPIFFAQNQFFLNSVIFNDFLSSEKLKKTPNYKRFNDLNNLVKNKLNDNYSIFDISYNNFENNFLLEIHSNVFFVKMIKNFEKNVFFFKNTFYFDLNFLQLIEIYKILIFINFINLNK